MFWTNWNEQLPSIMRSTLSGRNAQAIISTDILTPNGLTIDHRAEKLYFSDGSLGKIERSEYDGSQRYVSAARPRTRSLQAAASTSAGGQQCLVLSQLLPMAATGGTENLSEPQVVLCLLSTFRFVGDLAEMKTAPNLFALVLA